MPTISINTFTFVGSVEPLSMPLIYPTPKTAMIYFLVRLHCGACEHQHLSVLRYWTGSHDLAKRNRCRHASSSCRIEPLSERELLGVVLRCSHESVKPEACVV